MEVFLEFFIYLFSDTVISIEQARKDSKTLRVLVLVLVVLTMFSLLALSFLFKNDLTKSWGFLVFAFFIAIFLVRLSIGFIKIKQRKE